MNNGDRILLNEVRSDIKEIKECLLGSEYHPGGIVSVVRLHTEDIEELKTKQSRIMAFWGGITMFATIAITSVVNFLIFRR